MRRLSVAMLLAAGWALPAAGAHADIAGPDDSLAQAYGPLSVDTWYAGQFKDPGDVDYASFVVGTQGAALHFELENTVRRCTSPSLNDCPVYLTLLDSQERQLGGEGSGAGTGPVTEGYTEAVDWTFDAPGRYYVALDSDGDNPSYRMRYAVATPPPYGMPTATSTPTRTPGPTRTPSPTPGGPAQAGETRAVRAVHIARHAQGHRVSVRLTVASPLERLTVRLTPLGARPATRHLTSINAGRRVIEVPLRPAARRLLERAGTLRVRVTVDATPAAGAEQQVVAARTIRAG